MIARFISVSRVQRTGVQNIPISDHLEKVLCATSAKRCLMDWELINIPRICFNVANESCMYQISILATFVLFEYHHVIIYLVIIVI